MTVKYRTKHVAALKTTPVFLIESVSTLHWSLTLTLKWPSGKSSRCGQSGGHPKQPLERAVLFLDSSHLVSSSSHKNEKNKQTQNKTRYQQSDPQINCF